MHFLNCLAYILLSLRIPNRRDSDCGVPHLEAMCLLISALVRGVSFPIPHGGTQYAHMYRLFIILVSLVRYLSFTDFNSLILGLYFCDMFCCFCFCFIFSFVTGWSPPGHTPKISDRKSSLRMKTNCVWGLESFSSIKFLLKKCEQARFLSTQFFLIVHSGLEFFATSED